MKKIKPKIKKEKCIIITIINTYLNNVSLNITFLNVDIAINIKLYTYFILMQMEKSYFSVLKIVIIKPYYTEKIISLTNIMN